MKGLSYGLLCALYLMERASFFIEHIERETVAVGRDERESALTAHEHRSGRGRHLLSRERRA